MEPQKRKVSGFRRFKQSAEATLVNAHPAGEDVAVLHVADGSGGAKARRSPPPPDLAVEFAGQWLEIDADGARIRRAGRSRTEDDGSQDVVVERPGRVQRFERAAQQGASRGSLLASQALSWLVVPPVKTARVCRRRQRYSTACSLRLPSAVMK